MSSDLSYFDESRYQPPKRLAHEYRHKVAEGYARMQSEKVVIAGLARNIETVLPMTRARIERLGSFFKSSKVLIYENDSADRTPELLDQWRAENANVHLISESLGDPVNLPERCLKRAERMAKYRNRCRTEILNRWPTYDSVILVDTDVVGGWSFDGIANTFGYRSWDYVGSCGIIYKRIGLAINRSVHYDAWAYRQDAKFTPMSAKEINKLNFKRGEPFIPLYSCFGGLGVYRMEAFGQGVYDGDDMEHAGFHRSMRQNGFGRQFLNPSQIVVYGRKSRSLDPLIHKFLCSLSRAGLRRQPRWMFSMFGDKYESLLPVERSNPESLLNNENEQHSDKLLLPKAA